MSTQSDSEFLWRTPPYCNTVECYVHGFGEEHHVEGCVMYDTLAQNMHRLGHAMQKVAEQMVAPIAEFKAELRKTYRGRVMLFWLQAKSRFLR